MKDPNKATLDKAVKLALEGYGLKAIMGTTGLSHSQVELAGMAFLYYTAAGGTAVDLTPEACAALRYYFGISWGRISVMGGLKPGLPMPATSESKVRRMAAEHSGTDHVGNRIGRGGRWFQGDEELYKDNLKESGTLIPVGQRANARQVAEMQSLLKLGTAELRARATEAGITTKGKTPAQLVKALTNA